LAVGFGPSNALLRIQFAKARRLVIAPRNAICSTSNMYLQPPQALFANRFAVGEQEQPTDTIITSEIEMRDRINAAAKVDIERNRKWLAGQSLGRCYDQFPCGNARQRLQ
jgi:hypothetical protein